jgi:hypothetical protein
MVVGGASSAVLGRRGCASVDAFYTIVTVCWFVSSVRRIASDLMQALVACMHTDVRVYIVHVPSSTALYSVQAVLAASFRSGADQLASTAIMCVSVSGNGLIELQIRPPVVFVVGKEHLCFDMRSSVLTLLHLVVLAAQTLNVMIMC